MASRGQRGTRETEGTWLGEGQAQLKKGVGGIPYTNSVEWVLTAPLRALPLAHRPGAAPAVPPPYFSTYIGDITMFDDA